MKNKTKLCRLFREICQKFWNASQRSLELTNKKTLSQLDIFFASLKVSGKLTLYSHKYYIFLFIFYEKKYNLYILKKVYWEPGGV